MSGQAAEALEAYLSIRHRLPGATPGGAPSHHDTLEHVAGPFDVILLDSYGVLNVGESPVPGSADRIAAMRAAGKTVMVVSNSAGYPKRMLMQRYARLGFDFAPEEVATSREALLAYLAGEPVRRWGMMLSDAYGTDEFEELHTTFLADDPEAYDAAEGFLLVGSDGWTEHRQDLLENALRARPRPVIVGNPDIVAPREDGLSREPGHYAHHLADRTGIRPVFLGKPFAGVYDLVLSRLPNPPDPSRVLMVGDTLHTDILGGRHMGFATALVTGFGALKGLDPADAIARSGISPDFIVERI
ncbi:HAD-IIA family hydrolase [Citreimonas salinaria]|uniref:HAD-superfamily class IIA hydrolase, TIGR01459 n=1 Tax=Citreimonas salinaria TaxID=321339 RepID=A0A1H3J2I1_9RHOB|nr:HAD hydrolase-like protein [Citreimonas salinaria]SDY34017.1 HAD-superfamily class IIA hydrolase, TIGR01459 [Citreimonas salinaria]